MATWCKELTHWKRPWCWERFRAGGEGDDRGWEDHLILCYPLLLLPSIFLSIKVFSSESALIRWPKYQSFRITISLSSEYSELISFRIDWFDFLAVQGTLKSFLQNSVLQWASFLWCSAFFIAQLPPHTWLLGKPWKFIDMCMYVTYISMGFHDFKKLTVFLRLSYQTITSDINKHIISLLNGTVLMMWAQVQWYNCLTLWICWPWNLMIPAFHSVQIPRSLLLLSGNGKGHYINMVAGNSKQQILLTLHKGFPCGSAGKEFTCSGRDLGSIPGLERSLEKGKSTHSSTLAWRIPWTV